MTDYERTTLHDLLEPIGVATETINEFVGAIRETVDALSVIFTEMEKERVERMNAKEHRRVMRRVKIARTNHGH